MAPEYPVLLSVVTVTTGTNDTIVFHDGTADRTATIAAGDYYLRGTGSGDLRAAIATAFAAAPSSTLGSAACALSYDIASANPAGVFTFSADAAFTLKSTGTFDLTLLGFASASFPISSTANAVASTLSPKVAWVGDQPYESRRRSPVRPGLRQLEAADRTIYTFNTSDATHARSVTLRHLAGARTARDRNTADPYATYEGFWETASGGGALELHTPTVSSGSTLASLAGSTRAGTYTLDDDDRSAPRFDLQALGLPRFSLAMKLHAVAGSLTGVSGDPTGMGAPTLGALSSTASGTVGSAITLTTAPGSPFVLYDPNQESTGNISVITNRGSDTDGDLDTTPGSANVPSVETTGGPVTDAQYFKFDLSNTEALTGPLATNRTGDNYFGAVMRWNGAPTGSAQTAWDGASGTTRHLLRRTATNGYWEIESGTFATGAARATEGEWVRVVGRYGSGGLLSIERAEVASGDTGADDLTDIYLGCAFAASNFANTDLAVFAMWESSDGTSLEDIENWLEENFDFAPVPPGNPVHWWDPNDYAIGSVPTLTNKGSGAENLTCTAVTVELDASANGCGEQKVFNFNGSTSKAVDDGAFSLTGDVHLFALCARPETAGAVRNLVGNDSGGTSWHLRLGSGNAVVRDFGTTATGDDLDTLAPFNTSERWLNLQFLTAAAAGNGATYVDGNSSAAANEGDNDPDSLMIGGVGGTADFNGKMSDVIIYTGAGEANATRAAEVEQWLQRWRRLSTRPGAPFIDLDADALALNDGDQVSTWANPEGGDFTQTSTNRPRAYNTGGPEPAVSTLDAGNSVKRVLFDGINDYMNEASRANKTQPITTLAVVRATALPGIGQVEPLVHSVTGTAANNLVFVADGAQQTSPRIDAGTALTDTNPFVTPGHWYLLAAEHNSTTSHLWWTNSGTSTGVTGNAGTEQQDDTRIGANAGPGQYFNGDFARMIQWDDGTTFEEAQEYGKRRFPNTDKYSGTGL